MNILNTILACMPVLFYTNKTLNGFVIPKFAVLLTIIILFFLLTRKIYFNKYIDVILILCCFNSIYYGLGWEPFESLLIILFCLYLFFLPEIDTKMYFKVIFFFLAMVIPYQVIMYSLTKHSISVFTGSSTISAVILAICLIGLWKNKITGFKIRISLLFISLPALLLLRSRSVVIALFLTLIFIGKKKILKFLTVSLILTQIILIIVLFICPDKILDQTDLNYRFYIWRCASDKFNNLHKTGINLFKKDSYELQLKVTEANHNYLYYINQIDTLHNDFLQVFYDYSFIGILLIFFLLFRCIKHDSTCFNPIIFFILSVSVFHNLIYSPAFLFFIAPLCKSFLPRREIKFSKIPSTMTIMILSFIIILFFSFFIKADYLNENGLLTMDMTMFEKSIKLLPGYYYPYSIIPQMDESRHKLINTAILYRKDPNFYLIKGLNAEKLYFKTGKTDYFKESIFSYQSAVKLDPLNIKTRMSLFDLYKLNGMSKEADSEMHYIKNLKLPTRLKDQIRLQDAFKNIISHKGTKTQREKKEN